MATIAVCCTTFVINLHMRTDDDEMPDWVRNFAYNYLMKIACWKNSYVCRRNKVKDKSSKSYNHTKTNGNLVTAKSKTDRKESVNNDQPRDLTWKELSEIMDKVFYNVYMILISLATFVLFMVIVVGYCTAAA
jgi:hypothetical protein